jgi:large subunit ribosomal protein L4
MPAKKEVVVKKALKPVKAKGLEKKAASEKVEAAVKVAASSPIAKKPGSLSVPVYSLAGKTAGSMDLPKDIFGAPVNSGLLAQAMRVYLNNQKSHNSTTKTRAEVTASTRKIYKQKGTGRARHGANSAPLFVGGGKAMGAKYRKTVLDLPKKMKRSALISALSEKASTNAVFGVMGMDKATGKTKEMTILVSSILSQLSVENKKAKNRKLSALLVLEDNLEKARRASRNIQGFDFATVEQINAYEVIKHQSLILTKDAAIKLSERLAKKEEKEKL